MEHKSWWKSVTYAPRIDYVSFHANELLYVLAIEKLLGIEVPRRASLGAHGDGELNRIHSHLVWLGTSALEARAISLFWYCFDDRDQILDLFEMAGGTRMHTWYVQVGGLAEDLPPAFTAEARKFCESMPKSVDEYEAILDRNAIWLERTKGVGLLSADDALALAQSGPMLRSTGVDWDLRRDLPYLAYDEVEFDVPVYSGRRVRPLQGPHGRDARVGAHRLPVPRPARRDGRRALDRRRPQGRAASAPSSTPRWSRSSTTSRSSPRASRCPRGGLPRHRVAAWRGGLLPRLGRWRALAREVPRAELRGPAGDRRRSCRAF